MKRSTTIVVTVFLNICALAISQEAILKIYATRTDGTSVGSGFFSSDTGRIITAYHVVDGAKKIEVSNGQRMFTDIRVQSVSSVHDIAILQAINSGATPYIKLRNSLPRTTDNLEAQGYPLGGLKQTFRDVHPTRDGFVSSLAIIDGEGQAVFNETLPMEVVQLSIVIYRGMSGGPVLDGDEAIGILSGSYQEGGGIAWAIPSKYTSLNLREIEVEPSKVVWENFTLMTHAWKTLRQFVRVDTRASAMFHEYMDSVEALAHTYEESYRQAQATYQDISMHRIFIESVANDASLAKNPAKAHLVFVESQKALFESLDKMSSVMEAAQDASNKWQESIARIGVWIVTESGLSPADGQKFVRELKNITDQYKDLEDGLAEDFNMDEKIVLHPSENTDSRDSSRVNPVDEARGFLSFLDILQPIMEEMGSFKFLALTTAATSMQRRIGQLFEPIVYRSNEASIPQEPRVVPSVEIHRAMNDQAPPQPRELFPETRQRLIKAEEFSSGAPEVLRYAINELYARYGYSFPESESLRDKFKDCPWYHPNAQITTKQIEAGFTPTESYNMHLLAEIRKQRKSESQQTENQ
jgi:hypothetical protein